MKKAASFLVGEHDFAGFCTHKPEVTNTVRTVYSLDVEKEEDMITLRITGNGFLYNMVRIIAGTLIRVGGRKLSAGICEGNPDVKRPFPGRGDSPSGGIDPGEN